MTLKEAIERYTSNAEYERTHGNLQGCLEFRQLAEWLKDYKRLLEQEPCEDAISREDALMALTGEWTETTDELIHRFIKRIKNLPPVNPQPKIGHWIAVHPLQPNDEGDYMCSVCRCGGLVYKPTKFCPNCGAKMVETKESEE